MSEKAHSTASGEQRYYCVEARYTGHATYQAVNGVLLTKEWTRLPMRHAPDAVPSWAVTIPCDSLCQIKLDADYLGREAAYALAVRFQVGNSWGEGLCVETRLVEVKLKYEYSLTEVGVCEPIQLFEMLRDLKSAPREPAPAPAQDEAD